MSAGVNSFLKNIVNAYNKKESKLAEEEKRETELMPPISSHTLRHTGCTRLGDYAVCDGPFRCTDHNECL